MKFGQVHLRCASVLEETNVVSVLQIEIKKRVSDHMVQSKIEFVHFKDFQDYGNFNRITGDKLQKMPVTRSTGTSPIK